MGVSFRHLQLRDKAVSNLWKRLGQEGAAKAIETLTTGESRGNIRCWHLPNVVGNSDDDIVALPFGLSDAFSLKNARDMICPNNLILRVSQLKRIRYCIDLFNTSPEELYQSIGVLLYGIPGIGKSVALNILALAALKHGKTLILQHGYRADMIHILKPDGECISVVGGTCELETYVSMTFKRTELVYLFDPIQFSSSDVTASRVRLHDQLPHFDCPSFFATSPKSANINFEKHTGYKVVPIYPWTCEEIIAARPYIVALQSLTEEEIKQRFKHMGGSLRRIISPTTLDSFVKYQYIRISDYLVNRKPESICSEPKFIDDALSHSIITHEPPAQDDPDYDVVTLPDPSDIKRKLLNDSLVKIFIHIARARQVEQYVLETLPIFCFGQKFELSIHFAVRSAVQSINSECFFDAVLASNRQATSRFRFNHFYDDHCVYDTVALPSRATYSESLLGKVIAHIDKNIEFVNSSFQCTFPFIYCISPPDCSCFDSYSFHIQDVRSPDGGQSQVLVVNLFQITAAMRHDMSTTWDYFHRRLNGIVQHRNSPASPLSLRINFSYVLPEERMNRFGGGYHYPHDVPEDQRFVVALHADHPLQ